MVAVAEKLPWRRRGRLAAVGTLRLLRRGCCLGGGEDSAHVMAGTLPLPRRGRCRGGCSGDSAVAAAGTHASVNSAGMRPWPRRGRCCDLRRDAVASAARTLWWPSRGCRLSSPRPRGRCRGRDVDANVVSVVAAAGMLPCPAAGMLSADRGDATSAVAGMRPWPWRGCGRRRRGDAALSTEEVLSWPQRGSRRGRRQWRGGGVIPPTHWRRNVGIFQAAGLRHRPCGRTEA